MVPLFHQTIGTHWNWKLTPMELLPMMLITVMRSQKLMTSSSSRMMIFLVQNFQTTMATFHTMTIFHFLVEVVILERFEYNDLNGFNGPSGLIGDHAL